jgi:hypothetical protein
MNPISQNDSACKSGEAIILQDTSTLCWEVGRWSFEKNTWLGIDGKPLAIFPTHWMPRSSNGDIFTQLSGPLSVYLSKTRRKHHRRHSVVLVICTAAALFGGGLAVIWSSDLAGNGGVSRMWTPSTAYDVALLPDQSFNAEPRLRNYSNTSTITNGRDLRANDPSYLSSQRLPSGTSIMPSQAPDPEQVQEMT